MSPWTQRLGRWGGAWMLLMLIAGCASTTPSNPLAPSNQRDWSPDLAVLPHARFRGEYVDVYNIRNCQYFSPDVYTVDHYHKTFDLRELDTVQLLCRPVPSDAKLGPYDAEFWIPGAPTTCPSPSRRASNAAKPIRR